MVQPCHMPPLRPGTATGRALLPAGQCGRASLPAPRGGAALRQGGHAAGSRWPQARQPVSLASVDPVQRFDSRAAVANGLRVVPERDGRIRVAGDLGDQTHLDALRL